MKTNIERCDDFVQGLRKLEANDHLLDWFIQRYLELYQEMKDTTVEEEQKALFRTVYVVFRKPLSLLVALHALRKTKSFSSKQTEGTIYTKCLW